VARHRAGNDWRPRIQGLHWWAMQGSNLRPLPCECPRRRVEYVRLVRSPFVSRPSPVGCAGQMRVLSVAAWPPRGPKRVSRSRSSLRHEIRSETRCPIACTHGSPRMCHRESRPSIVPKSTQVQGQTSPDTTLMSSTASAAHWPGRRRAAGSRVQGEVDEQIFQGSDRRSTVRWPVTRRPRHRAPDRVTNLSACSVWKTTHANMLAMIA
jgi:hypothetical protein